MKSAMTIYPRYLDYGRGCESLVSIRSFHRTERNATRSVKTQLSTAAEHGGFRNHGKEKLYRTMAEYCRETNVVVGGISSAGLTFAQAYPIRYETAPGGYGISPIRRLLSAGADALLELHATGGHIRLVLDKGGVATVLLVPPQRAEVAKYVRRIP